MSIAKKIALVFLIMILAIQFFRPAKNQGELEGTNHISSVVPVPSNIGQILKTSCYDCHSNNTVYPWYSEIMPFGWWLNHHIDEGKAELNFSDFKLYSQKKKDHKLEEIKEEVLGKEMPLESYTLIHKNAVLTNVQINIISNWVDDARKTLNKQK